MSEQAGPGPLERVRAGGKAALARALARIEEAARDPATVALLEAAWAAPIGRAIGLTGPPGVGKSTLASALIGAWRGAGRTVAVLAVDPSSRRTGGALLGDRTRLALDPEDEGLFVRSLAARDRLGGVAALCFPMLVLLRALYERVLIETVGVGQSETEVIDLADLVLLAVQPASGDSLQFLKAGIAEIPDLAVVTKADLGAPAERTARELEAAMALVTPAGQTPPPVLLAAASKGQGIGALLDAIEQRLAAPLPALAERRTAQARRWLEEEVKAEAARRALARLAPRLDAAARQPFAGLARLLGRRV
ncbi:MAG: methylmalonyl Co-A mutase-associated GTPase MeaB [Geminicoccaceae bacterium]|nr:methylmalonyl Co-A mutase-associated GTPase MeaB [Geminicoccaceae bacterium]MCX8100917.1 methylmalonyl Co-A mutase-associated GTPase MeaB [Geminicoccaceae bacterium]MDW8368656.1 methylmalonyl Co-A mutase-associated GTPase MeaB [Geminicoccaceae bacterium]